jgi:hypothetical protein
MTAHGLRPLNRAREFLSLHDSIIGAILTHSQTARAAVAHHRDVQRLTSSVRMRRGEAGVVDGALRG